jgi:hypothetical protein
MSLSLSLPGTPGISMARRSMPREGRLARRAAPAPEPVVTRNSGRLGELAEALKAMQAATGLDSRDVAVRLLQPLDGSSPLRAVDVFAAGRADLVTAYLDGTLDGPGLLRAWQGD